MSDVSLQWNPARGALPVAAGDLWGPCCLRRGLTPNSAWRPDPQVEEELSERASHGQSCPALVTLSCPHSLTWFSLPPALKQQTCLDCKKNFCTSCSSQVGAGPRLCLLCQRVCATGFRREELMKMKVKDLRDYLSLHDISTDMCREKEELVFLVLGQQPVISQEGRTQAPPLGPDFPEQQAFLTRPHTSTVPPTSPGLPSAPPGQAQGRQQVQPRKASCLSGAGSGPSPPTPRERGSVRGSRDAFLPTTNGGCFLDCRLTFGLFLDGCTVLGFGFFCFFVISSYPI